MTDTADPTPNRSRLGPFERAIRDRDIVALRAAVESRSVRDELTGCLLWAGALTPAGYARVGRGRTAKFVHRLTSWGEASFVGELRDWPHTHHLCGRRNCVEKSHLVPVTSAWNTIEAGARAASRKRITDLQDALRAIAPDHHLLSNFPELGETPALTRDRSESPRERIRRSAAASRQRAEREANRQRRFEQVLNVQRLQKEGRTYREALEEAGIARRTYEHWAAVLREWLENPDG